MGGMWLSLKRPPSLSGREKSSPCCPGKDTGPGRSRPLWSQGGIMPPTRPPRQPSPHPRLRVRIPLPHFPVLLLTPVMGDAARQGGLPRLLSSPPDHSHGQTRSAWRRRPPGPPRPTEYMAHAAPSQTGPQEMLLICGLCLDERGLWDLTVVQRLLL